MRFSRFQSTVALLALTGGMAMSSPARATVACPPDVAPPGGDGTVNVTDLLAVIGAWGSCPGSCPPACAADVNSDCSVNVTDLLAVIGGWGPCPCVNDPYEPNPDCNTVRTLNGLGSDQTLTYTTMTLSSTTDADYYRIHCTESDNTCYCGTVSFDEDYIMKVTLTVPVSAAGPYEFCMNANTCNFPTGYCFSVAPGTSQMLSLNLDGNCSPGQTDSYDIYVRISPTVPVAAPCQPYTLTTFFDAGYCQ